jgi:hypothetical protein
MICLHKPHKKCKEDVSSSSHTCSDEDFNVMFCDRTAAFGSALGLPCANRDNEFTFTTKKYISEAG